MFVLTVILCIANAIATLISFLLYVKARLADRTEDPGLDPSQQADRLATLDKREHKYLVLHFITLFLFVGFGVLILVQISHRLNSGILD